MNADLTFNSIVFKKSFDTEGLSLRQSAARGVNTPDLLKIQSQDYVDSATKVAGRRFTVRVDRVEFDADNAKIITSAYVVIAVPATAPQESVDAVIATFKAAMADANLITNVLNNEK